MGLKFSKIPKHFTVLILFKEKKDRFTQKFLMIIPK